MILNILLIIILLVVFYRLMFNSVSESYENPFIYSTRYVDNNKLPYTPVPYIPETDPQTKANIISDYFIEKNNQLIIDLADNSNFIIDDSRVKNVKMLAFADSPVMGNENKCLDVYTNSNMLTMNNCDSSKQTQKWTLSNNKITNSSNSKCLSYSNESLMVLLDCNNSSYNQTWVPDTNNLIHNLNNYSKCLEINDDTYNSIKVNTCDPTNNRQIWHT